MTDVRTPSQWPVIAALIGGTAAVALGIAVMLAQGGALAVPYALMNATAVIVGVMLAAILLYVPASMERWLAVAAALALLATACWGAEIDGIRRWALVGPVRLQPAFALLPLLLCMYARRHGNPWYGGAVIIAALAIALQPDRSMTLPLVMVSFAIWLADRTPLSALVLGAVVLASLGAWAQADPLIGVRFVESVFADGWRAAPLFGVALTVGALAMLAPFFTARHVPPEQQRAVIAFTFTWGMLLIASLIGAYPTPLLGYGASAIVGYALSIVALRKPTHMPLKDSI